MSNELTRVSAVDQFVETDGSSSPFPTHANNFKVPIDDGGTTGKTILLSNLLSGKAAIKTVEEIYSFSGWSLRDVPTKSYTLASLGIDQSNIITISIESILEDPDVSGNVNIHDAHGIYEPYFYGSAWPVHLPFYTPQTMANGTPHSHASSPVGGDFDPDNDFTSHESNFHAHYNNRQGAQGRMLSVRCVLDGKGTYGTANTLYLTHNFWKDNTDQVESFINTATRDNSIFPTKFSAFVGMGIRGYLKVTRNIAP